MSNNEVHTNNTEEKKVPEEIWEYHDHPQIFDMSLNILEALRDKDNEMYTHLTQSLKAYDIMKLLYKKHPHMKSHKVFIKPYDSCSDDENHPSCDD
jgi:hypothetical protein